MITISNDDLDTEASITFEQSKFKLHEVNFVCLDDRDVRGRQNRLCKTQN